MSAQKSDRRVRYTKMVLKNALIDLMEERPISKITIKDICAKADVNRGTFYAHYTDQTDLLNQISEDFLSKISEFMNTSPYISDAPVSRAKLINLFNYMADNRRDLKILFGENSTIHLEDEILSFIVSEHVFDSVDIQPEQRDYLDYFVAYGFVGIMQRWLASDSYSSEILADYITKLTGTGLSSFL